MQIFNSSQRYGVVVQLMHWSTVLLVVAGWLLGTFGDELPKGAARDAGLFIHMSAGTLVLAIVVLRALWRIGDPPPPPERTPLGDGLDRVARYAHYALYILLIAVPVTGILTQFARGRGVPLFGLSDVASPWAADRALARAMKERHEFAANVLAVLAGVHAVAALAHHWLFRDRTLKRMLPGNA